MVASFLRLKQPLKQLHTCKHVCARVDIFREFFKKENIYYNVNIPIGSY